MATTGNALTDATTTVLPVSPTAGVRVNLDDLTDTINSINQTKAAVASDCLWPPSAKITIPLIPGLYHQSFDLGCLISRSQARAIAGVALLGGGLLVILAGLGFFAVVEAVPFAARVAAKVPVPM
jgi:hypothetical protein